MSGRELHRRSTYARIGLQRQWHLPRPDSVDVLGRFVRHRQQRKVPRVLYVIFLPHRSILCLYRRLRAEEGERNWKHVHHGGRVYIDPLLISRRRLLRFGLHGAMPDLQQQHGNVHASRLGPARRRPCSVHGLNRYHLRRALHQHVRRLLFSTRRNAMLGSDLHEFDAPVRQDLPREWWCLRYSQPRFGDVFLRL
jgi:hypothetical protein